jgi:hypothetical protein
MVTIPAGRGVALSARRGQCARIINTFGTQVVDSWAFVADEYLSMEHCREVLQRLCFEVGDALVTNRYREVLTIVADTSPGGHDSLIAACSRDMFLRAGRGGDHDNCADNLHRALRAVGMEVSFTPSPWNLFMRAPVRDGNRIEFVPPLSRPGDYLELRVEADCMLVFSACPDDVYPTNGGDGSPRDAEVIFI